MRRVLLFTVIAVSSSLSFAIDKCTPTLEDRHIFQVQTVSSIDERWDAISKFASAFTSVPKSPNGHLLLILSSLPEDQDLASTRLADFKNTDALRFVDLREHHINEVIQAWDANYRKQKLVLIGGPNDLKKEISLTRIIDENLSHVELVLVSEVGKVFPNDIVQIESKLVNHQLNRTLRLYQRVTRRTKTTEGESARPQIRSAGSKPKTYAMDEKVAGPGRNLFEFSIMPGRSRADSSSPAWKIFREWIRSTRVSKMRAQFYAHPGFQFLFDNFKRYHTQQKLNYPWWSVFNKTELTKLVSAGIISSLTNEELLSIWSPTELKMILAPSRLKYLAAATQENTLNYILSIMPKKYVSIVRSLSQADVSGFHSIMLDSKKDPEFALSMHALQKEWEQNEIDWQVAFDREVLAHLHYWNIFRLSDDDQMKYLGMKITDNIFGREKNPVHFETMEKWAAQIAGMEKAIKESHPDAIPFLMEEGSYYRRFFNKLKMVYPVGNPNSTPWPHFFKAETLEKLFALNVLRERPPTELLKD